MPLSEWELWACAQQVINAHGDRAARHVAQQLGALALSGDAQGIATWQAIGERIAQLTGTQSAPGPLH